MATIAVMTHNSNTYYNINTHNIIQMIAFRGYQRRQVFQCKVLDIKFYSVP